MHPLDGVWLKVRRGRRHMNEANRLIKLFRKSKPYSIREDFDRQTGDKLYIVNDDIKPVPPRLSAIVGDALFNFRSALDHLAWQLVIAKGGKPTDRTAFPICINSNQWGRAEERLKGMDDRAKTIIKFEQPCFTRHNYHGRMFTLLELLCNIDKHRHLHLVQAATGGGFFDPPQPVKSDSEIFIHDGIVESNTILARFPRPYSDVNFFPAFDISFGEIPAQGELVYRTLYRFGFLLQHTIGLFNSFFPISTTPKLHRFDIWS